MPTFFFFLNQKEKKSKASLCWPSNLVSIFERTVLFIYLLYIQTIIWDHYHRDIAMLLGVTNKKQVLIDLGIDDTDEADDAADESIAGGQTQGPGISVTS